MNDLKKADPTTRQILYDLINDKAGHVIAPTRGDWDSSHKGQGPHYDPDEDVVRFDPGEKRKGTEEARTAPMLRQATM